MKKNPYDVLKWFFSPSEKLIVEEHDIYSKLVELEDRIRVLEEENVGQSNALYECWNSLDARIDIIAENLRAEWDV